MLISRRLRGIIGIGTTWGVAFSALATTLLAGGLAIGAIPSIFFGPRDLVAVAVRTFLAGGFAGGIFAALFAGAERRRTLATVSQKRVALWGFLGAATLPALASIGLGAAHLLPVGVLAVATLANGVIGGVMSVATVRIARRAREAPEVVSATGPGYFTEIGV